MSVTIPLRNDLPDFEFQTDLDGVTYGFRFRLNLRDGGWYFDLTSADGVMLVAGKKVTLARPLLLQHVGPQFPPGALIAQSTTGDTEPGPSDLGSRVRLLYLSAAEVAAL